MRPHYGFIFTVAERHGVCLVNFRQQSVAATHFRYVGERTACAKWYTFRRSAVLVTDRVFYNGNVRPDSRSLRRRFWASGMMRLIRVQYSSE